MGSEDTNKHGLATKLLAGLALVSLTPGMCSGELTGQQMERASKACAYVVVIAPWAPRGVSGGSGFFIEHGGRQYLVTNYHVIEDALEDGLTMRVVVGAGSPDVKGGTASVVAATSEDDLALLAVDGLSAEQVLELAEAEPAITDTVWCFGYPLGDLLAADGYGPEITVTHGRVTSLRRKAGRLHQIQTDAAVAQGSSGGPVLDDEGKVVGVTYLKVGVESGLNMAIPAWKAVDLLFDVPRQPDVRPVQSDGDAGLSDVVVCFATSSVAYSFPEKHYVDGHYVRHKRVQRVPVGPLMVPRVVAVEEWIPGRWETRGVARAFPTYGVSISGSQVKVDYMVVINRRGALTSEDFVLDLGLYFPVQGNNLVKYLWAVPWEGIDESTVGSVTLDAKLSLGSQEYHPTAALALIRLGDSAFVDADFFDVESIKAESDYRQYSHLSAAEQNWLDWSWLQVALRRYGDYHMAPAFLPFQVKALRVPRWHRTSEQLLGQNLARIMRCNEVIRGSAQSLAQQVQVSSEYMEALGSPGAQLRIEAQPSPTDIGLSGSPERLMRMAQLFERTNHRAKAVEYYQQVIMAAEARERLEVLGQASDGADQGQPPRGAGE